MDKIKCKECNVITKKHKSRSASFCNQSCYMSWKRKNPKNEPYKDKAFSSGYFYLYKPEHPNAMHGSRYISEHRFNMEQKIGRLLTKDEIVHHINENKIDNRIENLQILTRSEHNKYHALKIKRKNGKFSR